jgi:hypothetical protein
VAKILSGEAEHTLGGTAGELRALLTRVVLGRWVEFGLFNCGLYTAAFAKVELPRSTAARQFTGGAGQERFNSALSGRSKASSRCGAKNARDLYCCLTLGNCDRRPPCVQRRGAEAAVRRGRSRLRISGTQVFCVLSSAT